jgi:hydrogenase expression/formation protein HypE
MIKNSSFETGKGNGGMKNIDNVLDLSSGFSCPIPITDYPTVLLAHGGGGRLTHRMIEEMFLPAFYNRHLDPLHDGAVLSINGIRLAFSTDSFVVHPIFFPGGDIGQLAVNGTINDLTMCGAQPLYLSTAFIIEEGLAMNDLWRIVQSMQNAAQKAGVTLVTGDTKVVDRGKGDKIFINTSGIGMIPDGVSIDPKRASPGDAIIVSGSIAVHGVAIMSVREGLEFDTAMTSDTAALNGLVSSMLDVAKDIHVLRDPTRGGIATALNEVAASSRVGIVIREEEIPIDESVGGACEILGLDPLYVANEGKLLAFVSRRDSAAVLNTMRQHPLGRNAQIIGEVVQDHPGTVVMKTQIGTSRIVDMLTGEQLPRIC